MPNPPHLRIVDATSQGERDPVSGLLQRLEFEVAVEAAVAESGGTQRLALYLFDFPQFVEIARGSFSDTRLRFLKRVGERLAAHGAASGIAARFGGARYALLLPAPDGATDAAHEAKRLSQAVASQEKLVDGTDALLRPFVGYALTPDDTGVALDVLGGHATGRHADRFAEAASSLLACADLALEHALAGAAARPVRFVPDLVIARRRVAELGRAIGPAIEEGDTKVAFQPVVDIATMRLVGFEALLRWRHPDFGPVPPPEAVAIAERNGQLCALTRHVMRDAIRHCREWPSHVTFAVNVSPSQLTASLVTMIGESLRQADVDPARLEIEVTEDALIRDVQSSSRTIDAIRALGVSVAMDDFGAGFTSLGNLRRLAFDKIKIDRSLCEGLGENRRTDAIVAGLVRIAHTMGIAATVEGVETNEQLAALEGLPCLVQGYVFSPPVPPSGMDVFRPLLGVQRSRPAARKAAS